MKALHGKGGELPAWMKKENLVSKICVLKRYHAPPVNRTRGPTMATLDFTTKPVVLLDGDKVSDLCV